MIFVQITIIAAFHPAWIHATIYKFQNVIKSGQSCPISQAVSTNAINLSIYLVLGSPPVYVGYGRKRGKDRVAKLAVRNVMGNGLLSSESKTVHRYNDPFQV